jgi:hypothetical protein
VTDEQRRRAEKILRDQTKRLESWRRMGFRMFVWGWYLDHLQTRLDRGEISDELWQKVEALDGRH